MPDKFKKGTNEVELIIESSVVSEQIYTLDQLKEQKERWVKTKENAQDNIDYLNLLIAEAKKLGVLTQDELIDKNK